MNDEFLYQFQKQPQPEFAYSLFRSLQTAGNPKRKSIILVRFAWGLGILCLISMLTLTFSSSVRARVINQIIEVGNLIFEETDRIPPLDQAGDANIVIRREESINLEKALLLFPGDLQIPTWLPEGYELDTVHITLPDKISSDTSLRLTWWNLDSQQAIYLNVDFLLSPEYYFPVPIQVGYDSIEVVEIEGIMYAVVHGLWDGESGEFISSASPYLIWRIDNVEYMLLGSDIMDADTLIKIASSARK